MQKLMRIFMLRQKAWFSRLRSLHFAWMLPFMLIGSSHALPNGLIGTLYNGSLPSDAKQLCGEGAVCRIDGIKELWYGARNSWIYKLTSGNPTCNNSTFPDPLYGVHKLCYVRDLTTPEVLPPALTQILFDFDLNDLLTVQNKRYTFSVMDGNVRNGVAIPHPAFLLRPAITPQRLQQSYFQFDITDGASPIRQHSIFVSPTFNRCLITRESAPNTTVSTYGRIVEIYSLTSLPASQLIPQRSDVQKICTNDKGQLKFNVKPPSSDAFQMKIVNYDASGNASDVFDFFIPINFTWLKNK